MVANKNITKIVVAVMAVAVALCLLAIVFSDRLNEVMGGTGVTMEYESKLFNTDETITIDIRMDDDQWETMLANATSEEYYVCDVVVNGKTFKDVAIRPKGNTSLSAIAMDPDSNRFSLKLEFDHYIEGQTCYGLDKLILNNNYADATNMKETIIYDMYQYLDVDSSLYNYAEIYVNGEYWGVYLALEAVEESFMLRNYGTQDGELYKPETMEIGGDMSSSAMSMPPSDFSSMGFDMSNMPSPGSFSTSGIPGGVSETPAVNTEKSDAEAQPSTDSNTSGFSGTVPEGMSIENMPSGFSGSAPDSASFGEMPSGFSGTVPEGMSIENMPSGFNGAVPDSAGFGEMPSGFNGTVPEGMSIENMPSGFSGAAPDSAGFGEMPSGFNGTVPEGMSIENMPSGFNGATPGSTAIGQTGGADLSNETITAVTSSDDTVSTDSGNTAPNAQSFSGMGGFDMSSMGNFDFSGMGNFEAPDMGDFDMANMGFSMGGGGANLNYSDDELDSYSTIWAGSVTNTTDSDHRKVVTALKNISEGTDLETYMDVDNILKYMAVHTFAVNMDSLSGSMAHNYFLYEYGGQLNIIPWDYNLSFGGMSMGNAASASEVINDAIDTPFSGTHFFDALLENEEYLERYHEYLQQLVDEYVNGGRFDEVYNKIRSTIDTLIETDPTAFYTYEEYLSAADMLYDTIKLRAESIDGQIKGTIPSTDAGQRANSSALIDASGIDINLMGQFNMGNSFSGFGGSDSGMDFSSMDFSNMGGSFDMSSFPGEMPSMDMTSFGGVPGQSGGNTMGNAITFAGCFGLMLIALLGTKIYKRRKY